MPAVLGVKEGINLPRYPTLKGRLASKKVDVAQVVAGRRARWPADGHAAAGRPSRSAAPSSSATAPTPRPPWSTCSKRLGVLK